MATQSGNNGSVTGCTRSSTGRTVTVEYTNPDPPPDKLEVSHTVTEDQYDDLVAALAGDLRVDTVYDDGTGNPISSLTLTKPS